MFSKEEIAARIDEISGVATAVLKTANCHEPSAICYTDAGPFYVSLDGIMEEAERRFSAGQTSEGYQVKSLMWAYLRGIAKQKKCFGIVIMMEVWLKMIDKEVPRDASGMPQVVSPRFSPDRQEALAMTWEFKMADGSKIAGSRQWIFRRGPDQAVAEIGEPNDMQGGGIGAATGFLE